MAAFRHRFLPTKSILVHGDREALTAERRATWTGRAEVWRWGEVREQVCEYDFANCYAHLARDLEVPVALRHHGQSIGLRRLENIWKKYAVLADIEIETEAPCVPARHDDHILWPVGRFRTTLWDQELQLVREEGAKIEVLHYWTYRKAPVLREWAIWILDLLHENNYELDPIVRIMLKDWSRALIGRFGLRYSEWDKIALLPSADVSMYQCSDTIAKQTVDYLQIGNELSEQSGLRESPNSLPSIMGYIMSAARVRLWQAMKAAGWKNLLYVDTDGFIVAHRDFERLSREYGMDDLPDLRRKALYNGAVLRAPRNIDLGETRRVNGAPRKSERLSDSTYRGEVWESLPTALRRHRPDRVLVSDRVFHVSDHDPRRIHLPDGSTAPIRLG